MEVQTLEKAPIKEAVFEVLLNYPEGVDIEAINRFGEILHESYPIREDIIQFSGNLPISGRTPSEGFKHKKFGFSYRSRDSLTIIQTRLNGFSYSRINKSYTKWEDFYPEAKEWFFKYANYVGAKSATRISLRYINEIELPKTINNLKEYIVTTPELGGAIKYPMSNLFMRVELINEPINSIGIIQQTLNSELGAHDKYNLYFDIDVIRQSVNPTEIEINEPKFNELFEQLRIFKNFLFFESLTAGAANLFK